MRVPLVLTGREFQKQGLLSGSRYLLVAPPEYDFRHDWSQWHQPTGLLQIASLLRNKGKDIRLIDALHAKRGKHLPRHKIEKVEIDGYKLTRWHFGLSLRDIELQVNHLISEDWQPDTIFITSLNSIWWEGARDTITTIRQQLPDVRIVLGGAYPTLDLEHAMKHSDADIIVTGSIPGTAKLPPDLALYSETPYATGIYLYTGHRTLQIRDPEDILIEIKGKSKQGVHEFVFFDELYRAEDSQAMVKLFSCIAAAKLKCHFVLQGNMAPNAITRALAIQMREAKVTQVYLHCGIQFGLTQIQYTDSLDDYERCISSLSQYGGFIPRDGTVAAMLVVGLPYEDLEVISDRLIQLSHIMGSVILVPFQYIPGLHNSPLFAKALNRNGHFSPEQYNSRLFPLARLSGKKLEDYMELTRLTTLLNSKYRSKTFDFLGDNMAAQLFRESIRTEGWNPFRAISSESQEIMALESITKQQESSHDHS